MSLTAISSLESARRKFFMNTTDMMSRKLGIKRVMGSGGLYGLNLAHPSARWNRREENFS